MVLLDVEARPAGGGPSVRECFVDALVAAVGAACAVDAFRARAEAQRAELIELARRTAMTLPDALVDPSVQVHVERESASLRPARDGAARSVRTPWILRAATARERGARGGSGSSRGGTRRRSHPSVGLTGCVRGAGRAGVGRAGSLRARPCASRRRQVPSPGADRFRRRSTCPAPASAPGRRRSRARDARRAPRVQSRVSA